MYEITIGPPEQVLDLKTRQPTPNIDGLISNRPELIIPKDSDSKPANEYVCWRDVVIWATAGDYSSFVNNEIIDCHIQFKNLIQNIRLKGTIINFGSDGDFVRLVIRPIHVTSG